MLPDEMRRKGSGLLKKFYIGRVKEQVVALGMAKFPQHKVLLKSDLRNSVRKTSYLAVAAFDIFTCLSRGNRAGYEEGKNSCYRDTCD